MGGELPAELFVWTKLTVLSLAYNDFVGLSDYLGAASSLEILDLTGNEISGELPESISALENLQSLLLTNNMINGTIPESINEMGRLVDVRLDGNQISGVIPTFAGATGSLRVLRLGYNAFEKQQISESLFALPNITDLRLNDCSLTGRFRDGFWEGMPNIETLHLQDNKIGGGFRFI